MDVSRFHATVKRIANEYQSSGVEVDFNSLVTNLGSLVSNPGNAQVSQAFKDQLNQFRAKLEASSLNDADAELLDTLKNHDLIGYVGNGLFTKIKKILDENQLTPNLALTAIDELRIETTKKLATITTIDNAFAELKVEFWQLEDGVTEMLISIPIEEETKTLEDLAKEAKDWHRICDVISETFDIERNRVTIRAVASGSILLYLAAVPVFILGVAKCLKGVNQILTEVIKMKDLYNKLSESNPPDDVLKGFEAHKAGKAKVDLESLASSLVEEFYKGGDDGRKNELKNSLSLSLQRLSQKLALGAKVNLRLAVPKKPQLPAGEDPTEEQKLAFSKIELLEKVKVEVASANAALDYKEHATELMSALPAPAQDSIEAPK